MIQKKIQFFFLLLLLLIAGFSAWFVFEQSQQLKNLNQGNTHVYKQNFASKKQTKEKGNGLQANTNGTGNASLATTGLGAEGSDLKSENATQDNSSSLISKIQDVFLISFVVKDAADYFANRYYPAKSSNNAGQTGQLDVSFKTLNARYGLELVGVKYSGLSLEVARRQVLNFLMDSEALRQSYALAADDFIRSLIEEAEESQKHVQDRSDNETTLALNGPQVSVFLSLCSEFFSDLASVVEVLTQSDKSVSLVKAYLQAEQQAKQANYEYIQDDFAYEQWKKEIDRSPTQTVEQQQRGNSLKVQKKEASEAFREAIHYREQVRQELMTLIHNRVGSVQFNSHEILYVAKWMQRRFQEGRNKAVLQTAAGLLRDLSRRLNRTALSYKQSSAEQAFSN